MRVAQRIEQARCAEAVNAYHDELAASPDERIAVFGIVAGHDLERQLEQLMQFAVPVAHQTGWRHHHDAADRPA